MFKNFALTRAFHSVKSLARKLAAELSKIMPKMLKCQAEIFTFRMPKFDLFGIPKCQLATCITARSNDHCSRLSFNRDVLMFSYEKFMDFDQKKCSTREKSRQISHGKRRNSLQTQKFTASVNFVNKFAILVSP